MNLNTLTQGEPWMTPAERDLNREFVHATTELLAARGVPESPLALIRVNDVIATWILARRLEAALAPEPGEPAPCPTPAQAGAIGKCRDRLRRAMKELEACCPRDAAPLGIDLIGPMHEDARQRPEASSGGHTGTPAETRTTESAGGEIPNRNETPVPGGAARATPDTAPTPQSITGQTGTCATGPGPSPPPAPPVQPPQPAAQPHRRRKSGQKCTSGQKTKSGKKRKKRGVPIRPSPS